MSSFAQRITIFAAIIVGLLTYGYARAGQGSDPYTGGSFVIMAGPGVVTNWQAENYDLGGEGIAFHDPNSCGTAGTACGGCPQAYRNTLSDGIRVCAGPPVHVTYIDVGAWLNYSIYVNKLAWYTVELSVAFADATCCAGAAYHIELDAVRYPASGSYALGPALTAGWTSFEWRGKSELIPMMPGEHVLRIVVDQHWFNLDAIRVRYAADLQPGQVLRVYP